MMNKKILVWVMFGLMMILMFNMLDTTRTEEEKPFSDFMYQLNNNEIAAGVMPGMRLA